MTSAALAELSIYQWVILGQAIVAICCLYVAIRAYRAGNAIRRELDSIARVNKAVNDALKSNARAAQIKQEQELD